MTRRASFSPRSSGADSHRGGLASRHSLAAWVLVGLTACTGECTTETDPPCGELGSIDVIETDVTIDPAHTSDVEGQGYNTCGNKTTSSGWVWTSDDQTVATVQRLPGDTAARITAISEGTTFVRAEANPPAHPTRHFRDSVKVTVNPIGSLTVTPSAVSLMVGESAGLVALPLDQGGSAITVPVTWSSAGPSIVAVTTTGQLTASVLGLTAGTTIITARVGSVTADVPVAVAGQSSPSFVSGTMRGFDDLKALPGMSVGISRSGTTVGNAVTDASGQFTIDVSPGGDLRLFAQGVCDTDPAHPCNDELSFNSTELEQVIVANGETVSFDPRAQRGYHLRITSGAPQALTVTAGSSFQLQLGYQVWNRAGLDGAAPRIVLGIDGDAGPVQVLGVAHVYPGTSGTADLTLTAPTTPTTYGVYAYLVTAAGTVSAESVYEANFQGGRTRQYIRLFTLTVQ